MRKLVVVVALSLVSVLALAGWSCGSHRPDPEKIRKFADWRVEDFLDDLDATDAQRRAVAPIKDRILDRALGLHAEHQLAKKELVAQWDSPKPDAARVHAVVDQRLEALRTLAHDVADGALQLHGILTLTQRAEVSERIHEHMDER